jgi:hypothetical protein
METVNGVVLRKKYYHKDGKVSGVAFRVKKDRMSPDTEDKWFGFWLNDENDRKLYEKYGGTISKIPESSDAPSDVGFTISGTYETNQKGFRNLKSFEIEEHDVSEPPEQAQDSTAPVTEDAKATQSNVTTQGVNWANRFTQKDTLMARMSALKAAGPIVAEEVAQGWCKDADKRTKELTKNFMQFIERGE